MDIEISIKNYRCFSDQYPARITLRKGFTAFVGPNNSGKSSLLRFFYEFRHLFDRLSPGSNDVPPAFSGTSRVFEPARTVPDINEVFSNSNDRDLEIDLRFPSLPSPPSNAFPFPSQVTLTIKRATNQWLGKLYFPQQTPDLKGRNLNFATPTQVTAENSPIADLSYLFDTCKHLQQAIYIGSFRNALNLGSRDDYFDIQVGEAFIRNWRALKTGYVKSASEAIYSLTNNIKHLFGFENLEINASADEKTLQIFINGKSFKLSELGSGLTQFVLVLANAAIKRPQPSYILLDEPELSLHPYLQLDFLTSLGSYTSHGVIFATHSIGLARAGAELIYSVQKNSTTESQLSPLEKTANLSELLGELSFSGYRELGFNKILLVEGPTETKTIQQFLRLYKKDHENGTKETEYQLEEIKRISSDIFALIDSERASAGAPLSPSRQAFLGLCQKMSIDCHVLDRRAIENYFPDRAVKQTMTDNYRALDPFEDRNKLSPCWSKADNWRIARNMTQEELEATGDLAKFIAHLCSP